MRYTRRGRLALWPLLVFLEAFILLDRIRLSSQQTEVEAEQSVDIGTPQQDGQGPEPLPTAKWNQFKGFFTPRPLPENAHFTFASVWASWSSWSYCDSGIQMRVRACNTIRGFSCLGPNREIRPCQSPIPPSTNRRFRQFQLPSPADVEDPWAEDRKEAFRQLYTNDPVEAVPVEQKPIRKNTQKGIFSRAGDQQLIGAPSARPELFASKLLEPKVKVSEEMTSLEEMELGEFARKLDVKEPAELAEKLTELGKQEEAANVGKQRTITNTMPTTQSTTTTTLSTPPGTSTRTATTFSYSTNPAPIIRTTVSESSTSTPAGRLVGQKKQSTAGRAKVPAEPSAAIPIQIAEDTARALEWIMENMTKSVESVQWSRARSEEQILGRGQPWLHSGEAAFEQGTGSAEAAERGGKRRRHEKPGGGGGEVEEGATKEGDNSSSRQLLAIKGDKMASRHRQRLISELSKAQQAKMRQIEKSREQMDAGQQQQQTSENQHMEQELGRLRSELKAMESVLARMRSGSERRTTNSPPLADQQKDGAHSLGESVDDQQKMQSRKPEIVFPVKKEPFSQARQRQARQRLQLKRLAQGQRGKGSAATADQIQMALASSRRPASLEEGRQQQQQPLTVATTEVTAATEAEETTATSAPIKLPNRSLILTEQPESIWLDGSVPRMGSAAWSAWLGWGPCICGRQMRSRHCLFEDDSFHSKGCVGKSYESRQCVDEARNCPTTIPPIPPSKLGAAATSSPSSLGKQQQAEEWNATERPKSGHLFRSNLRKTALSIGRSVGNDEQQQQRMGRRRF